MLGLPFTFMLNILAMNILNCQVTYVAGNQQKLERKRMS